MRNYVTSPCRWDEEQPIARKGTEEGKEGDTTEGEEQSGGCVPSANKVNHTGALALPLFPSLSLPFSSLSLCAVTLEHLDKLEDEKARRRPRDSERSRPVKEEKVALEKREMQRERERKKGQSGLFASEARFPGDRSPCSPEEEIFINYITNWRVRRARRRRVKRARVCFVRGSRAPRRKKIAGLG